MPYVRHHLGVLRLKRIPELHLREDDSAERGTRVMQLIEQVSAAEAEDGPLAPEPERRARRRCPRRMPSTRPVPAPMAPRSRSRPATAGTSTVTRCARRGDAVVAEGLPAR